MLKSRFCNIYNSIKLSSNHMIKILIEWEWFLLEIAGFRILKLCLVVEL